MTQSIATTVRTTFRAQFPVLAPGVPISIDGFPFDPKVDAIDSAGKPIPYVDLTLLPADRRAIAVGNDLWRNDGIVWIRCYTVLGTGPDRAAELARLAGSVFEGKSIGGVTFRAARPERRGPEDQYYRWDSLVTYLSDETQT